MRAQGRISSRAELTQARQALEAEESFLEYLIDLQGRYGISNTFF